MLLPRPGKHPLQVRVLPLRTEGVLGLSPASVLVLVTDPEQATAHPAEPLRLLYGFTASEAEIANQLCAGLVPEPIAELRHVSLGTVRVQIKQLMHKAGVRRQAELVRLMLMLPRTFTSAA
ncbi:MAG TPA: LuxR C-terminal-related transcriptional regulator [Steroidobacteraceae bacterium]|jgi:DNA-binding NarL/FixJ family response regulator|nr:LuxR C-terminal-related transcriptional regulator [Steroidobacteraceae bacterium]